MHKAIGSNLSTWKWSVLKSVLLWVNQYLLNKYFDFVGCILDLDKKVCLVPTLWSWVAKAVVIEIMLSIPLVKLIHHHKYWSNTYEELIRCLVGTQFTSITFSCAFNHRVFVITLICSLEVIHAHEEIGLALAVLLCRGWLWWEEINPLSFLGAFLYGRIMS